MPISSDPAILVDGLGKCYRIGRVEGAGRYAYRSFREEVVRGMRTMGRRDSGPASRMFWALRDVSFQVEKGERVGIIGRNGAGKSTLLKVLSRITPPTTGRGVVRGRLVSLLEVGTGFHPELTGRENIHLCGAILGMRRKEIKARIDQIVEFSGVERFLDTPVKRFSSGMYLRLAFSVAAHVDPEILLVDEVLAVGDADFQKKCLGRMEEIGSSGRTVLFVSHAMPAVLRLCDRVILLDGGRVVADGAADEVVREYMSSDIGSSASRRWLTPEDAPGDDVVRLKSVSVKLPDGRSSEVVDIRSSIQIEVQYWQLSDDPRLRPSAQLHFTNDDGVLLFISRDAINLDWGQIPRRKGTVTATCSIPGNFLAEGQIFVLAAVASINPTVAHAIEPDAVSFQVVDRSEGDGVRGEWVGHYPGVVRPTMDWSVGFSPHSLVEDS